MPEGAPTGWSFAVSWATSSGLAFEGMKLSRDGGNTVLTGPVVDQAQLAGIIGRVHELGLDLISVATVEPTTEPPVGAWER